MEKKRGRGRPQKENLLDGFFDLDTGKPAPDVRSVYFPSMQAAVHTLGIPREVLRRARSLDCKAFRSSSNIHRGQLVEWLKEHGFINRDGTKNMEAIQHFMDSTGPNLEETTLPPDIEKTLSTSDDDSDDDFEDNYELPEDEKGGVGQTLKSLQAYERQQKRKLDQLERSKLNPITKSALVKEAHAQWIKTAQALLKYDLSVSQAKRESGELIPIKDACEGVKGLMAWHTVAMSDALRNVIPECEGKDKFQIASLIDGAIRSSIYRNFKLGFKLGKIPEWMVNAAGEQVRADPPLEDILRPVSTDPNDY